MAYLEDEDDLDGGDDTSPEIEDNAVPRGRWKGTEASRHKGGAAKPGELLKHFRMVWKGKVPEKLENDPGIASIRMLKLENNEKFLAELRTLEKAHDEKVARRRADAAKKQEAERAAAPPPAAKDQTTEDSLALLDDLLKEAVAAASR